MSGSITDVSGLRVGHAHDAVGRTGVTVIWCDPPAVGSVDRRGAAVSTRQCDSLLPQHLLSRVDAVVLTGGSAFGLGASSGVMDALAARGAGMPTPGRPVPIVPCAALFDLGFGSGEAVPTPELAAQAFAAAGIETAEGSVGAGHGATVGKLFGLAGAMKGGVGTASRTREDGLVVGALAAVNAWGDVIDSATGAIVAGAREPGGNFADIARVLSTRPPAQRPGFSMIDNTVLVVVATNAKLDKNLAGFVARMAQTGLARAVRPCHGPYDGDVVFALSTGNQGADLPAIGQMAADAVSEAIVRAVQKADGFGILPAVSDL
ncbi:MAG: P1 family peptidase [Candidatus Lernaella stagnicola]|nr:P1 family peptidase [Candidatus Lernaella stagnicola]